MCPKFYVSMAPADNVGRFTDISGKEWSRVSLINIFPSKVKENLLFSMSFKSDIHYESMKKNLDPLSVVKPLFKHQEILPRRMFADCGAFQFRNLNSPILPNGDESNAKNAWEIYQERHLEKDYPWEEILLCAPDHIICDIVDYTQDQKRHLEGLPPNERKKFEEKNPPKKRALTNDEYQKRVRFNREQAKEFIKFAKDHPEVTPVAVIHGHFEYEKDLETRKKNLTEMINMGYEYVALGGMVPYSNNKKKALKIIAGINDLENPIIDKNSILGQCQEKGVGLHIFGLTAPDWYRWFYRLKVTSFDGSKLATEGALNGFYWVLKDDGDLKKACLSKPISITQMYTKIKVDNLDYKSWKWTENKNNVLTPEIPSHYNGIKLTCQCPACQYLKSARCPSKRCWLSKEKDTKYHTCEPLMRGSNEHNMGRAAHNAHIYAKLIEYIEKLNKIANDSNLEGENEWLKHWATIEVSK